MEDVTVTLVSKPNTIQNEIVVRQKKQIKTTTRHVEVSLAKTYKGNTGAFPRYIMDIKDVESDSVSVCGVVSNVKSRFIEKANCTLYTCLLNDTTATIPIKMFVREMKKFSWDEVFSDGATIVVRGEYKMDTYENRLSLLVRDIALAQINFGSIDVKSDYHTEVNDEYTCVFPAKYTDVQGSFFDGGVKTNEDLLKNTYVVFDLETTGLDHTNERITEIGAVKIENGEITETFNTFINPCKKIPEEVVALTNITDEMVKDAPKFGDVVADFYKFTKDCILVGHNVMFDLGFLSIEGRRCKYEFDNAFIDTMALAKQKLRGQKKFKLGVICKVLGISLEGAHRAVNDAMATAKVFIELLNKY